VVREAPVVLECVVNLSEGRDRDLLDLFVGVARDALLDIHSDPDHNRTVLTLLGEDAVRAVASVALEHLDIASHAGAHPRLGVVDVVPFVALEGTAPIDALAARAAFEEWWAAQGVPCFRYGPERSLPDLRRHAFTDLAPDAGPPVPHPTAGATAVGARPPLVAYNVWLHGVGALAAARWIARDIRGPHLRTLALEVGVGVQVSMNLIAPDVLGPAAAYDLVVARAHDAGVEVGRAELVGLPPTRVLHEIPRHRWRELDMGPERTIEARAAGLRR
jgi:glutamate formiminotransferase / 5-formyltetrahydrofolate cyclo-ligase